MGCVKITSLATYAFNAIMPLSRASTRGRYICIEGVTYRRRASPKHRYNITEDYGGRGHRTRLKDQ